MRPEDGEEIRMRMTRVTLALVLAMVGGASCGAGEPTASGTDEPGSGAAAAPSSSPKPKARKGVSETTSSGLIYTVLVEGDGRHPKANDVVVVHYHGTFPDGKVFDSSVERGQPARFPLNRVIPCWTEGVQKMKVGGKARLVCPPEIAYGARGAPPTIPPGATLHFEVELIGIQG